MSMGPYVTARVISTRAWHVLKDDTKEISALAREAAMLYARTYSGTMVKKQLAAFIEAVDAAKRKRHKG